MAKFLPKINKNADLSCLISLINLTNFKSLITTSISGKLMIQEHACVTSYNFKHEPTYQTLELLKISKI